MDKEIDFVGDLEQLVWVDRWGSISAKDKANHFGTKEIEAQ